LRRYEMLTIFSPHLNDEDLNAAIEQVQGYITDRGGAIVEANRNNPWGRRRLAYTIRHDGQDLRDGFYVLFYYDLEGRYVAEIERLLGINERVIRHMVIQIDVEKVAKQLAATEARAARKAALEEKRGPGGRERDRDRDRDRD
jgi:small subunit ribosomal protein S6